MTDTNNIRSGRIIRGDVGRVLESLPGACANLAILDPSYGLGKAVWDVAPGYDDAVLREVIRLLRPNGAAYVFGPPSTIAEHWMSFPWPKRLIFWQVSNRVVPSAKTWQPTTEAIVMCWRGADPYFDHDAVREPFGPDFERHRGRRRPPTPGRFGHRASRYSDADGALPRDVIRGPGLSGKVGAREGLGHPCQKPEWLLQRLIKASCPPGGTVLDLYAGTATASVAAHRLGRRWIAVESDGHWCEVALKRLQAAGAEAAIDEAPGAVDLADLIAWKTTVTQELSDLRAAIARLRDGADGST